MSYGLFFHGLMILNLFYITFNFHTSCLNVCFLFPLSLKHLSLLGFSEVFMLVLTTYSIDLFHIVHMTLGQIGQQCGSTVRGHLVWSSLRNYLCCSLSLRNTWSGWWCCTSSTCWWPPKKWGTWVRDAAQLEKVQSEISHLPHRCPDYIQ